MGKSSKDKRDAYYRLAKEQGWRARSAFKLLQLDEEFDLFRDVHRVVDLCAAPGSWSQVLSRVLIKGERFGRGAWVVRRETLEREMRGDGEGVLGVDGGVVGKEEVLMPRRDVKIVAVDLQPMAPLPGIVMLRADITHPGTIPLLLAALEGPVSNSSSDTVLGSPSEVSTTMPKTISSSPPPPPSPLPSPPQPPSIPPTISNRNPNQNLDPTTTATDTPTTTPPPPPPPPAPPRTTHLVDLILSDGAPDVTGLHDLDIHIQSQLLYSALNLSLVMLKPNGTFVAKIFRAKDVDLLYAQLRVVFDSVVVAKPRSSRASSLEAFVVCRGFRPPAGFEASLEVPIGAGRVLVPEVGFERTKPSRRVREDGIVELELGSEDENEDEHGYEHGNDDDGGLRAQTRWIAPFLATGSLDLSPDADATYRLPADHVSLSPVQPPTAPPYKRAIEMRRARGGAFGKTKGRNV